jgi:hypothetical protein
MGGKVDESGDEDDDDAADKMKKLDLEVGPGDDLLFT